VAVEDALARWGDAQAAVAVLLRERDRIEVLVTERARRESDPWSGHWSFPGGRRRAGESPLDAACRETEEEVGLALRECPPLGCLAARSPRNRPELLVLPILFAWDRDAEPRPGPEVASVEWVPLAELPRTRTTLTIVIQGRERPMPAFADGRHTIWGFTYRVLEDLLPLVP